MDETSKELRARAQVQAARIQLIADSLGPGLSCGCEKSYRCLRDGCIPCCYCGVATPEATPQEGE